MESVRGIETVKALAAEPLVERRWEEHLAGLALERGHIRFEWCALDWNEPALEFYKGLGATRLEDWRMLRLEQEGMRRLAAGLTPVPE